MVYKDVRVEKSITTQNSKIGRVKMLFLLTINKKTIPLLCEIFPERLIYEDGMILLELLLIELGYRSTRFD